MAVLDFNARTTPPSPPEGTSADDTWTPPAAANEPRLPAPQVTHEESAAMVVRARQAAGIQTSLAAITASTGDALLTRTADTVDIDSIDWLWPGFLARKFLNLVVGETAASKSTTIADIVARETTGRPWPGEPETAEYGRLPGRVLWVGSEDPMELLTVPRLIACGADRRRVTEVEGVTRGTTRTSLSLQDHLAIVREYINAAKREGNPYTVLVIDPITSYLHGTRVLRKVDMNDSGQLRTILEPWLVLAAETGIAIVGVTHLAKDTTRSLLHRVLGGGAFAQLCRSLIAVVNRYDEGEHEKALLQVKTNLPGAMRGAWRYKTEQTVVGKCSRGRDVLATYPIWSHFDRALTPEEIAGGTRGPTSRTKMPFATWVKAQFVNVPHNEGLSCGEVKRRAIESGGCSESWWGKHASEYLDMANVGGTYRCRPRQTP